MTPEPGPSSSTPRKDTPAADAGSEARTEAGTEARTRGDTARRAAGPRSQRTALAEANASRRPAKTTPVVVRAASRADDPAAAGVRVGLVAFITLATLAGLLAAGAIALHVGADRWLGVGPLRHGLGECFVTGVRLPIVLLEALYAAGVADPLFFGAAMALLIPPVAALAAARPHRPGAGPPRGPVLAASRIAAVLVLAANVGLAVRFARVDTPRFEDLATGSAWLESLRTTVAGDAVGLVFAVLITVLVFRMPVDRWVRRLVGSLSVATAIAALAGVAAGGGVITTLESPRPVVETAIPEAGECLLVGTTVDGRRVLLPTSNPGRRILVPVEPSEVTGHRSISALQATGSTTSP